MASITKDAFSELACSEEQHHATVPNIGVFKSGLMLLEFIVSESAADASIDLDTIRKELSRAVLKFKEFKCNVEQFNSWVKHKAKQLRKHGQDSLDLRTHIMSAHCSLDDVQFVTCINSVKDDIGDNNAQVTPEQLVSKARKKAEDPSKERMFDGLNKESKDQQILVLETHLQQLEDSKSSNGEKPKKKRGAKHRFPKELDTAPRPEDITKPKIFNGVKHWHCSEHG